MAGDRGGSTSRLAAVATAALLSTIPLIGAGRAANAQVGGLPLPPITAPTIPGITPTIPDITPTTTTSTTVPRSTTTSTTVPPKPNCDNFSISPAQPQWGQPVTLIPKGSFGSEPGTAKVIGLPGGAKDYSKSATLPLQDGTWKADSLKVVLPSIPPASQLDEWTLEVASGQVSCALNVPVVRILDCKNLAWNVQKAWKLKSTVNHLDGSTTPAPDRVVPLPLPMGPADTVALDFTRLLNIPSSLTDVLDKVGGGIRFGFTPGHTGTEEFKVRGGQFGFVSDPGHPDSQAANITVLPRPMVLPAENNPAFVADGQYKTLNRSLKLVADIKLPTDYCVGTPLTGLEILSIPLEQRPVVLPAIGVFFEHPDFTGDALAVINMAEGTPMPPGMDLPGAGAEIDGEADSEHVSNVKKAVGAAIQLLSLQAGVLQPGFPSGIPSGSPTGTLVPLPTASNLSLIAGQFLAADHPAIVAGGGRYELSQLVRDRNFSWFSNFNKLISSVATMGLSDRNSFLAWRCDFGWEGCTWVAREFATRGGALNLINDVGSDWDNRPEFLDVS